MYISLQEQDPVCMSSVVSGFTALTNFRLSLSNLWYDRSRRAKLMRNAPSARRPPTPLKDTPSVASARLRCMIETYGFFLFILDRSVSSFIFRFLWTATVG